jgi:hypothetical protein
MVTVTLKNIFSLRMKITPTKHAYFYSYRISKFCSFMHEVLLHPVKFVVRCAVSATRTTGPVFLTKKLTAKDTYRSFSGNYFQLTEEERLKLVSAHIACISMQALTSVFGERIISSGVCPASSPDLNPCDSFFWSCLKDKVYKSNPKMEELKEYIHKLQIFLQKSFKG